MYVSKLPSIAEVPEEAEKMMNGNGKKHVKPSNKKEKSVLQGKLTRLAIQIGYF